MKTTGVVYLVGAGPGDPELITMKATRLLREADVIVYDYLAEEQLLRDSSAEKIYVGKQGSNHTLTQDEINALIVKKAQEGKNVVRLKGGDTFIFGRGGEEAQELVQAGIPFEVVPGISSFYAAPAYAGIPITHRDFASSFEVISGHRRADGEEDVNFPDYNDNKTWAFLMGMKNLGHITRTLIEEKGFPADTPVGIITWGTKPAQRVVTGTLATIVDVVEKHQMKPPAIIVVGGVVTLRDTLRWFDNKPLFGKSIVVTRTRAQASKLTVALRRLGADVIEFPTIEIVEEDAAPLDDVLSSLSTYKWLVFTSQNAVHIFFRRLFASGLDTRSLAGVKIAAIGPASADELHQYGLRADLVPEKYVAEGLLKSFEAESLQDKKILLPCSADARMTLTEGLGAQGATVDRVHIYRTGRPEIRDEGLMERVKKADLVTFTSSSTAENFFALELETGASFASIGPVTSETVRQKGYTITVEADEYTIPGLVEVIEEYFGSKQ